MSHKAPPDTEHMGMDGCPRRGHGCQRRTWGVPGFGAVGWCDVVLVSPCRPAWANHQFQAVFSPPSAMASRRPSKPLTSVDFPAFTGPTTATRNGCRDLRESSRAATPTTSLAGRFAKSEHRSRTASDASSTARSPLTDSRQEDSPKAPGTSRPHNYQVTEAGIVEDETTAAGKRQDPADHLDGPAASSGLSPQNVRRRAPPGLPPGSPHRPEAARKAVRP
jgi:hypothetical protein